MVIDTQEPLSGTSLPEEEAPIFQIADYGLVADLFQALPEIDVELAKRGYN